MRTFDQVTHLTGKTHFISCELDEGLVVWTIEKSTHLLLQSLKKTTSENLTLYRAEVGNFKLTIIIGDIRKTLPSFRESNLFGKFNAIYQDAFSPKKNPTLWTTQWFEDLKLHSEDDCILSTYSAAMPVRKGLLSAGWRVFKRDGYGEKRSTTLARLNCEMNSEFLTNIRNSPEKSLDDKLLEK
ncbi:MnmC family methyltransferase [Halobacteriovorax sp. JY17]|uniref:MnmC family methyltransferase n=1 Tax=Halobacteriovorax sp. JY17 TaxID=2014617 RepID=UPI000C5C7FF2|nr:MnmC family methyltransferase [Halobacteriovorax sp. JY17]PIK15700.1 MAG: hypothetical protein CES88_02940 [Halobacteriovorax sp. JY17]